jgi:hypothetical protein
MEVYFRLSLAVLGFILPIKLVMAAPAKKPAISVTPTSPAASKLVSAGVGQVGGQVLTSREVQISYAVDQFLLTQGALKKNADREAWVVRTGTEAFREHLSRMMLEFLIKMEAESFSVAQVPPEEVKSEMALVKEGMKDWTEWKSWEVSEIELERLLFRRKMAKNFLKFKTESSGVVITDPEAKAYFEKNRVRFGSAPFAQFKEGIREVLAQQQLEEKLKDWFEILKRKYRVRFLKASESGETL